METNKKILGKIYTQRCSVTLSTSTAWQILDSIHEIFKFFIRDIVIALPCWKTDWVSACVSSWPFVSQNSTVGRGSNPHGGTSSDAVAKTNISPSDTCVTSYKMQINISIANSCTWNYIAKVRLFSYWVWVANTILHYFVCYALSG